jgi:hypothetical protein
LLARDGLSPLASVSCWFEKLYGIARGVLEQNLFATLTRHDVVSKVHPRVTQSLNLAGKIVHQQLNAIPAARLRDGRRCPLRERA